MKYFFSFFIVISPFFLFSKTISFSEALEAGWIKTEVNGMGGHTGKCLKVKVINLYKKKWTLAIPAGLIFYSRDTSIQDLMITQSREVAMEKMQNRTLRLFANCIQASNGSPGEGRVFLPGKQAEGKLARLAAYLDEQRIVEDPAQYAIWAVTDGKSIANIDHPGLMAFTAALLGEPLPGYTVVQGRRLPSEVQPAFQDQPSVIKGEFRYQTDRDIQASFGLYDEKGERLHSLFEGKEQRRGHHRFKFYFEVDKLPSGNYFARLTDENGETIDQLEVMF